MPPNDSIIELIKVKHCTANLINKINREEQDFDPFLNAQDCNIEWLKTLSYKNDERNKNLYYVSYYDNYNNVKIIIKLIVVKEKEFYKIDNIL